MCLSDSLSCVQDIFLFITRQLKGLEDTKSPQFNRYFYLLEVRSQRFVLNCTENCRTVCR